MQVMLVFCPYSNVILFFLAELYFLHSFSTLIIKFKSRIFIFVLLLWNDIFIGYIFLLLLSGSKNTDRMKIYMIISLEKNFLYTLKFLIWFSSVLEKPVLFQKQFKIFPIFIPLFFIHILYQLECQDNTVCDNNRYIFLESNYLCKYLWY